MYGADAELAKLVGGKVVAIEKDSTLVLADGRRCELDLDADCCSLSSFTDPKQFLELLGSTILGAEDRSGQSDNNLPEPEGSDVISWHFLVFTTDKGHVTVDWHNDSNGYYGGSLIVRWH